MSLYDKRLEKGRFAWPSPVDGVVAISASQLASMLKKLPQALYGQRSERAARLIEQMEFGLEEAGAAATEDEIAAEQAAACTTNVAAFSYQRPARQSFPEHLPR
jgi:transposase